jgi:hypothetical protein
MSLWWMDRFASSANPLACQLGEIWEPAAAVKSSTILAIDRPIVPSDLGS